MDKFIKENKLLVISILSNYRYRKFHDENRIDWDSVEQHGMIALWKAAQKYDESKGSFKSYAITSIKRAILREITRELKHKNNCDIDEFYSIEDDKNKIDEIEYSIDNRVRLKKVFKYIDSLESSLNTKKILKYFMLGVTASEIARMLNCTHQNTSAIISIHKKDLLNVIKEDN